ncbi:LacI family DNA-binding transcriptional regulator [Pseudalkalibacillus berkeleyi]|uniref:LacI family transcriptional regulator n=1 Tax=Pseudalkalibacillus berkeleyi TaxID=1069813 RepID=A0ABS9H0V2_9BACL|nr:LacI family DNA-binding transcriptional regulator [Pseudalkalibacillus berkeleyi]MCF6138628.1 LacI family transcriptional regulator [Pseudalkalibacillus berkeleyi]
MKPSIKNIAELCKLNPSTVSRALNNKYGVKPETRKSVMEAAVELGYVPNLAARELVYKKGNLVCIIIPESDAEAQPAFFAMLPYMNRILRTHGMETMIYAFDPYRYRQGELMELVQKRNLRGCIVLPGFMKHHNIFNDIRTITTPCVVLEVSVNSEMCSSIHTDEVYGAYIATQHIIDFGHTRIGFINGPSNVQICEERMSGYKKAIENAKLILKDEDVVYSDFTGKGGGEAIITLLKQSPDLTAVFIANDLMAMGAISKLSEEGYHIPGDISVVGFDGLFVSQYYNPPLTTIKNDDYTIAIQAAKSLMGIIEQNTVAEIRIKPELIYGKSVKRLTT